jgi:hypothetical protein
MNIIIEWDNSKGYFCLPEQKDKAIRYIEILSDATSIRYPQQEREAKG